MFFVLIGSIFFTFGWLLALNFKGAADQAFAFYSQLTPSTGTATPKTLRMLGRFGSPWEHPPSSSACSDEGSPPAPDR